ncbi:MAG: nuclear transport factor 2 family protein [Alphaproteobacteria bacterium]
MTDARLTLIERFFTAIETNDFATIEAIYADDVIVWHNSDNKEKDKTGSLKILRSVFGFLTTPRYEVLRRYTVPGGVAQSHILHAERPDGTPFAINAAIFFECDENHITRLEEFVDGDTFRRQMKA